MVRGSFIWFWYSCNFECDVLKLILSMWLFHTLLSSLPCPPPSPPPSSQKDCGTWHWHAGGEMCGDIITGSCTQEPKFRSEIATSSPLFPMETTPSAPQHLLSSLKLRQDRIKIISHALLILLLLLQWLPLHVASNHLIANGCSLQTCWWLF